MNLHHAYRLLVIKRFFLANIITFLLQSSGLLMSTLATPLSLIWFASGTACAFVFLRGNRILPGIWLGTLSAYYLSGLSLLAAINISSLCTLQAALLAYICQRYIAPSMLFHSYQAWIQFILLSMLLTLAATPGFAIVHHAMPFMMIWYANLTGVFVFSSALVFWDSYFPDLQTLSISSKVTLLSSATLFCVSLVLGLSGYLSLSWPGHSLHNLMFIQIILLFAAIVVLKPKKIETEYNNK